MCETAGGQLLLPVQQQSLGRHNQRSASMARSTAGPPATQETRQKGATLHRLAQALRGMQETYSAVGLDIARRCILRISISSMPFTVSYKSLHRCCLSATQARGSAPDAAGGTQQRAEPCWLLCNAGPLQMSHSLYAGAWHQEQQQRATEVRLEVLELSVYSFKYKYP